MEGGNVNWYSHLGKLSAMFIQEHSNTLEPSNSIPEYIANRKVSMCRERIVIECS